MPGSEAATGPSMLSTVKHLCNLSLPAELRSSFAALRMASLWTAESPHRSSRLNVAVAGASRTRYRHRPTTLWLECPAIGFCGVLGGGWHFGEALCPSD